MSKKKEKEMMKETVKDLVYMNGKNRMPNKLLYKLKTGDLENMFEKHCLEGWSISSFQGVLNKYGVLFHRFIDISIRAQKIYIQYQTRKTPRYYKIYNRVYNSQNITHKCIEFVHELPHTETEEVQILPVPCIGI